MPTARRTRSSSPEPNACATLTEKPDVSPFIEPMTKNVMDPVSPTPVNASGPMVLPTMMVSAML